MGLKSFFTQSIRVWHLLKKPGIGEFKTVAKISALGLGLIGVMGFIITILINFIQ